LSAKRAEYIAKLLRDNGVPEGRVETQFRGGINSYVPMEGNRNTCVLLYFK
jgi:outer membrane protein OmpA-like peptidoglycan-associated protein